MRKFGKHGLCLLIAIAAMLLMCVPALAQTAQDITDSCSMKSGRDELKPARRALMRDHDYKTAWPLLGKETLTVESPEAVSGFFMQVNDKMRDAQLDALVEGQWQNLGPVGNQLARWYPLPEGSRGFRIRSREVNRMKISELTVYGEGERPEEAYVWEEYDRCDLLLFVAHPDDELLWFGGLLPTYAGERGLRVQVAVLVPASGERRLELLDALRVCGVRTYPALVDLVDAREKSVKAQYEKWGGRNRVLGRVIKVIRQYRPQVIVTQGEKGEYGHPAHKVVSEMVREGAVKAAEARYFASTAAEFGTWQVQKVYLHEYDKAQVQMDWHVPLQQFGGRDAFDVAVQAMHCHASQVAHGWMIEDHGSHDNALFGLYASQVGPDEMGNDLMEHIRPVEEEDGTEEK